MSLISETNKIIDQQTIFFKTAMDVDLMMTVNDVRMGLRETTHGLIAIGAQIIDYLNRIDYQSRIVRKIRQLKYMRDQQMLADSTDIEQVLGAVNDVWMEPRNRYRTFVSLDFLRNEDSAIDILAARSPALVEEDHYPLTPCVQDRRQLSAYSNRRAAYV